MPDAPNAIKFETFVFDALSLTEKSIILEADRSEQFSPVKNKTGADSLISCQSDMSKKYTKALQIHFPDFEDNKVVEINEREYPTVESLKNISQDLLSAQEIYL